MSNVVQWDFKSVKNYVYTIILCTIISCETMASVNETDCRDLNQTTFSENGEIFIDELNKRKIKFIVILLH